MISIRKIFDLWDKFFFRPQPVEGIAIFRIIWCSLLLLYLFVDLGNAGDFYGPRAVISLETVKGDFPYPHLNLFHAFGNSETTVRVFQAVFALSLLFGIVGYKTRSALIIALLCLVSFHQRNIWLLSSSECLIRIITIYFVFAPAGNTLSVDAMIARRQGRPLPREWAPWVLRLIQIQVSVVYLWTLWHKLKGDHWLDGTAVYYATRLEDMTNLPVPFVLDNLILIKLMTWGTLILEFSLGTLIWVKEFRRPLIVLGILFHLGIEYMMSIPYFELAMMALLLNFFTPAEYRVFVRRASQRFRRTRLWRTRFSRVPSEPGGLPSSRA